MSQLVQCGKRRRVADERLPTEIVAWAERLLAQTRAVLAQAEAGGVDLPLEEVARLRETERELGDLLALDDPDS
jgi:hypothetical protein